MDKEKRITFSRTTYQNIKRLRRAKMSEIDSKGLIRVIVCPTCEGNGWVFEDPHSTRGTICNTCRRSGRVATYIDPITEKAVYIPIHA